MTIPPDFLDTLRTRADLPSLAKAEGIELAQAGRYWKACCPFHSERTPSFVITERHGEWRWHCYGGCGGGDAVDFVMRHRGFPFIEAVERVAAHAGLTFEQHHLSPKDAQKREDAKARRLSILEVLTLAQEWFVAQYESTAGEPARAEAERRGLGGEHAKAFGLGYAPDKGLIKELQRQKASIDVAVDAGLVSRHEGGIHERFRDRLMFPIRDRQGRVVGFSGRYLGEAEGPPKYKNTQEIPGIFEKGRLLFGLDTAWKAISQAGRMILVEGHVDALALQARGLPETVALMGTAFTDDHLRILEGLGAEVILLLDGDAPGRKATWKIAPQLAGAGIPSRVALLPYEEGGEKTDPDAFVRTQGVEALGELFKGAEDAFTAWVTHLAEGQSPMAKASIFTDEVAPVLARMSEAARDIYALLLRRVFEVKASTIRIAVEGQAKALEAASKPKPEQPPNPDTGDLTGEARQSGDMERGKSGATYLWKRDKEGALLPHKVMTGHIMPRRRIRLGEDGEILIADLECPRRNISVRVHWPASVWAGKRAFKESMPTIDFGWTGTDDELTAVMLALGREDVPIVRGTRVLGVHKIDGKWAFVATDKTLLAGGGETKELIHYADGETGVVYDTGQISAPVREDFQLFSVFGVDFSAPSKAASIVGWMFSVPLKERLAHVLRDKRFPFLCIWGERGAAKSVYGEQLILEFLGGGQTPPSMLNQLKPFSAMLTASLSNLVPFAIDEHKGETHTMREQALVLSETIRNTYQGGVGKRGRKDGRTQRNYPATSPLVVCGEDNVIEPAAQERMIEVFLAKRDGDGKLSSWHIVRRCNLPGLGLDYIRWTLDLPDEAIEREYRAIYDDEGGIIRPSVRDRIRHNIAVSILGLRMMSRWLAERGHPMPPGLLEQYTREVEAEQFKARFPSAAGRNKSIVDNMIEMMSAAASNGILREDIDYAFQQVDRHLCVRLQKVYPIIREWAAKTRFDGESLTQDAFAKQLAQMPYFLKSGHMVRFRIPKADGIDNAPFRTVVLDAYAMRSLGLNIEGFGRERDEHKPLSDDPQPASDQQAFARPSQGRLGVGDE